MPRKNAENEAEPVKPSRVVFENDSNSEDFEPEESDKNAIDAEILREEKYKPEVKPDAEEFHLDEFSQFLDNLPNDAEASFIVSRLPDRNLKGEFRQPCNVQKRIDVFYWNGETTPDEFYNQITEKHGGGKYNFQIREGKGFGKAWTQVLADPPFLTEVEKALKEETKNEEQKRNSDSSQHFVSNPQAQNSKSPIKDFLEQAREFKELNEIFSPAAQTPLPAPADEGNRITKESIKMALIEKSLDQPELLAMALRSVFDVPPEDKGEIEDKGLIIETIKYVAAHPNDAKTVLDTVLSSLSSILSPLASAIMPKQPVSTITPNLPMSLNSIRANPNNAQAASAPKNEPQPAQTAKNEASQPPAAPEIVIVPSLKLKD